MHPRRRIVVARSVQLADDPTLPAPTRLKLAAERLAGVENLARIERSTRELRGEQCSVYADFIAYLADITTRDENEHVTPMCRIIQPPRTGKTVIAGHIIAGTGLNSIFLVPSKTLVEQTAKELRLQLPGVRVGVYYGDAKEAVDEGVTVATYQIVQSHAEQDLLPACFRRAPLVFCDEAHQSMTSARMRMLAAAFNADAVRIALTATPDYDARRALARFFPDLVHEITLAEALELNLLAPLRVWVAEVDEDGSSIKVVAGDYQEDVLGRIMSSAPFFRAAEMFRYNSINRKLPALICCTTRQQATDLWTYLASHRPSNVPQPALILGDTPSTERQRMLEGFDRGEIDTIVNVGVLLQGWNAPRCKLLIDLAPSLSRVRAMQKFFRVMTRHGEDEARIIMIVPKNLPRVPLYPMDFLGLSTQYECGDLIERTHALPSRPQKVERMDETPIEKVKLKHRIVFNAEIVGPKLDPRALKDVREVICSNAAFNTVRLIDWSAFRWLEIDHPLFTGRGEQLIRYIGAPQTRDGYEKAMARLFPEAAGGRLLTAVRQRGPDGNAWDRQALQWDSPCSEDPGVRELLEGTDDGTDRRERARIGWRALGGVTEEEPSAEEYVAAKELHTYMRNFIGCGHSCELPTDKRLLMLISHYEQQRTEMRRRQGEHPVPSVTTLLRGLDNFLFLQRHRGLPVPEADVAMLWKLVRAQIEFAKRHLYVSVPERPFLRQSRTLSGFERFSLIAYFGLALNEERRLSEPGTVALREVGEKYGVSTERARQIVQSALRILRREIDDIESET